MQVLQHGGDLGAAALSADVARQSAVSGLSHVWLAQCEVQLHMQRASASLAAAVQARGSRACTRTLRRSVRAAALILTKAADISAADSGLCSLAAPCLSIDIAFHITLNIGACET